MSKVTYFFLSCELAQSSFFCIGRRDDPLCGPGLAVALLHPLFDYAERDAGLRGGAALGNDVHRDIFVFYKSKKVGDIIGIYLVAREITRGLRRSSNDGDTNSIAAFAPRYDPPMPMQMSTSVSRPE